jgi:pimeloyl-ACP methyl ester carboxylesterase
MNKGAGRGDLLYLTLHTETGKELLFAVDTGCPGTILDKSLEPMLGSCLGTRLLWYGAYGLKAGGSYAAPNLYLGNTRLLTDPRVATDDLRRRLLNPLAGRPVMGVIGMDCLRHYCVQLDFAAGKMLFLNPDQLRTEELGKAFPLRTIWGEVRAQADFSGNKDTPFRIDTGAPQDIILRAKLYKQQLRGGKTASPQAMPGYCEEVAFGGETYTNVIVTKCPLRIRLGYQNLLGLRFLGRHLVTLNFPKQTMYLQRQRVGPLLNDGRTLGWWERTCGTSSLDTATEAMTKCIMSAPNIHRAEVDADPAVFSWAPPRFIPVGLPEAELKVVELPPGDYHLEYSSTTTNDTRGEAVLVFNYHAERRSRPTKPVQERGSILLLHDYNGQKEHLAPWAFLLAQAGYHVFLVDLRGHGESTGQIVSFGKYETVDLCQVLDRLEQREIGRKIGILGIGMGANLALYCAARDPRIGSVVAIAPWNQPEHAFKRMAQEMKMSISSEALQQALDKAATRLDLKWADWSGEAAVRQLKQPVFLIGGGKDTISTTNDLRVLERSAPTGSKSLVISEADHRDLPYWFHELAEPVKAWFLEHQQNL